MKRERTKTKTKNRDDVIELETIENSRETNATEKSLLERLANDVLNEIANYLKTNKDLASLDQTSTYFHRIFSQDQQGALKKRKLEKLLIPLCLHVVRGEEEAVKAMLLKNPELALERGTVTDYSGREVISNGDSCG